MKTARRMTTILAISTHALALNTWLYIALKSARRNFFRLILIRYVQHYRKRKPKEGLSDPRLSYHDNSESFSRSCRPTKRKSPSQIDDQEIIEQIRLCALNPDMGFRETAAHCGIHWQTVRRICAKNRIEWVRKSKKGEIHSQYRRKKPIHPASEPCATENVSAQ